MLNQASLLRCTPSLCVQVSFGEVVSSGRAKGTVLWGAKVELHPTCQGLWLDLLPDSWQEETDMSKVSSTRRHTNTSGAGRATHQPPTNRLYKNNLLHIHCCS